MSECKNRAQRELDEQIAQQVAESSKAFEKWAINANGRTPMEPSVSTSHMKAEKDSRQSDDSEDGCTSLQPPDPITQNLINKLLGQVKDDTDTTQ